MVHAWEPGTQYNYGDEVSYHGHNYKIIQPHRSQSDWTPDITPALWGRLQDGTHHDQHHEKPQPHHPQAAYGTDQSSGGGVAIHEHEKEKNWYDIDEDRRKQIEIGGGLALGLGVLAGGYAAYQHHEKNEEEKKVQAWGLQNWLQEAQARRVRYRPEQEPVAWLLTAQGNLPPNAIVAGKDEDGADLFVARAFYEGGVHPGKALEKSRTGAVVSFGGKELDVAQYEVLCGSAQAVRWVSQHGPLSLNSLGARPVDGGRDSDGSSLYVARAPHHNGVHPGKCSEKLKGCHIPYGGKEVLVDTYEVLVWNQ